MCQLTYPSTGDYVEGAERGKTYRLPHCKNKCLENESKFTSLILLVLVAIVLVVVGLFPPTPLAASVTNNLWSISYIHAAYQDDAHVQALTTPPATHAHGGLLLGIRAIQDEQYDQALQFLEPLLAKDDPIALDAYAQILFHLGETQGAIAIWQKLGNLVSLELAATQLYESGELEPAIQIWQFLYQDDPEALHLQPGVHPVRQRRQPAIDRPPHRFHEPVPGFRVSPRLGTLPG